MNPADTAITLSDVQYAWPAQATPCIDIPLLQVKRGQRVFLHGPSGSGKSTLLNLLAGVMTPQKGQVQVLGTPLHLLRPAQRDRFRAQHMGFIFQQFNLLPWLSAIDNVLLAGTFSAQRRQQGTGSFQQQAQHLFSQLDLAPHLWHKPAAHLSVGQQQRVAAARALMGQPEIVIADEPTSALDAPRQTAFIELLLKQTHASNATLLLVSHDVRLAAHFDQVIALPNINLAASEAQA